MLSNRIPNPLNSPSSFDASVLPGTVYTWVLQNVSNMCLFQDQVHVFDPDYITVKEQEIQSFQS